ncbi:cupin domain-containing protein [Pedobacter frigidisoli]|uniref:Cupin domain-containing protein n=1 Tax=Pedobacter frigidisoli TaxID=2530455 RepID=A0A4R0N9L7_9SPHI|nr:cupin domain-containing protein [Pedobacter frigidisoli]TCC96891.1 cupin domain-containing protein [Pedobacter frigidisoli]
MENIFNKLTTIDAQDGKSISVMGDTYRIIISGKETNGEYAVIDMLVPSFGGPGPHAHADIQEAFYILDGEIEFTTEERKYIAKKGSFVNIPKGGLIHQFKNLKKNLAHMLCIVTPAGMEEMFEEIGVPVEANTFLPPPEMNPELMQKFGAIAEKYGQKLFPPDYLMK